MYAIIPGLKETFIIEGYLDEGKGLEEGKLYVDRETDRIFYYSATETRSNPRTGFFPIYNGKEKFISKHSKNLRISDAISMDMKSISDSIDKDRANSIVYSQRLTEYGVKLLPTISMNDNSFTQAVKQILCIKKYSLLDLMNMSIPTLSSEVLMKYYQSLCKISFMRLNKFHIWMHNILHCTYRVIVYDSKGDIIIYDDSNLSYILADETYRGIIKKKQDPFKNMIQVTILTRKIDKGKLNDEDESDYTINNMMTTIYGPKLVSAQIFSRFIRIAGLSFDMEIYENKELIFTYHEGSVQR